MAGQVVFYPIAEARVAEFSAERVPEHVAAEVGSEDHEDEQREAPRAEIGLRDDPKADERGDVAEEDCREIDNKISHEGIVACEERDGCGEVIHLFNSNKMG